MHVLAVNAPVVGTEVVPKATIGDIYASLCHCPGGVTFARTESRVTPQSHPSISLRYKRHDCTSTSRTYAFAMTTITYPHDCAAHAFRPHVPSPLSPRSTNIYGRRPDILFMNEEAVNQEERKFPPAKFTPQPKREVRKAKVPKQDELKEKRRHMFLRKVKEGREDKRWESRGEDVSHRLCCMPAEVRD